MRLTSLLSISLFAGGLAFGQAPPAQNYEGVVNEEHKVFAYKTYLHWPQADGGDLAEAVSWRVEAPRLDRKYQDYFIRFGRGGLVQIESSKADETTGDLLISAPEGYEKRFIRLTYGNEIDGKTCARGPVAVFTTPAGSFVSCHQDEGTKTVIVNRAMLLAESDREWLRTLMRVVGLYTGRRSLRLVDLGFLVAILDPGGSLRQPSDVRVERYVTGDYHGPGEELLRLFTPRGEIASIFRSVVREETK